MIGRLTILISFVLGLSSLSAQINIAGSFSRDTIVIGDEVEFILSIGIQQDANIESVDGSFLDSVFSEIIGQPATGSITDPRSRTQADVDIVDLGSWNDSNENGLFEGSELDWTTSAAGITALYESRFTLRFWDPGNNFIKLPIIRVLVGRDTMISEPVSEAMLFVELPEQAKTIESDSLELAPIKPILDEPLKISDFLLYLVAGFILVLFIVGFVLFKKYRKRRVVEEVIPEAQIPAHEIALTKLHTLREKRLWQKGSVVEFQTELTYIIREYLESRFEILALESTSYEILEMMKTFDLTAEMKRSLQRILQVADLVKFAKATPDSSIHEEFIDEALDLVRSTIVEKDETVEDE